MNTRITNLIRRHMHVIFFATVSLFILWRLLLPGYIFALDTVFPYNPHKEFVRRFYPWDDYYLNGKPNNSINIMSSPYYLIIYLASLIAPSWVIQKIILLSMFIIAGVSCYSLCPTENKIGKLFAGVIYVVNPWVYTRFLAGHHTLLLAYALMPYTVKMMISILENFTNNKLQYKDTLLLSLLITAMGVLQIHMLFVLFLISAILILFNSAAIFGCAGIMTNRRQAIKTIAVFILSLSMLNLYWIIPQIFTGAQSSLDPINNADAMVYASRSSDSKFSVVFNVAALYGFWRERAYILAKDNLPYWFVLFFIMLFFVVHGFTVKIKDRNVRAFGVVAVVSLALAVGLSSQYTQALFGLLFDKFPLFRGFRESHKFVGALVLSYAYLGGLGVADYEESFRKSGKLKNKILHVSFVCVTLTIPLAYTYPMFFNFSGQLNTTDYPDTWRYADYYISNDAHDFNVLFLPWHLYMDISWLNNRDKRIANPAITFFNKPVIHGDNVEVGPIYSQSTNPTSKYIGFILDNRNRIHNLGALLAPINVQYVILAKETDYADYGFLYNQRDLELVLDNSNLALFKNKIPAVAVYSVDQINTIRGWDDLIEITNNNRSISDALYVLEKNHDVSMETGGKSNKPLGYVKKNPVEYTIEKPSSDYVVFTQTYSPEWRLNQETPVENMGITNAFKVRDSDKNARDFRIYHKWFKIYAISYLLSGIAFIACLIYIISERKSKTG